MWPYLLKKLPKQYIFFAKLFGVCVAGHAVFLLMLFSAFSGSMMNYKVTVHRSISPHHANVVLAPLYKQVPKKMNNAAVVAATAKTVPQKKVGTSLVAEKKQPVKVKKEVVPVKSVAKAPVKKQPENIAKKEPVKKTDVVAHKKNEQKTVQQIEKLPVQKAVEQQTLAQNIDTNIYVGREEYEALQVQDALQQEVARCWHPPVGIAGDSVCEVAVQIDAKGVASMVEVAQSSGVLVYDMSARDAVEKMKFPKIAWNKHVTITFKQ